MAGKDKLANLAVELSLQNEQFIKAINQSTKRLNDIDRATKSSAKSLKTLEDGFRKIAIAAAAFYSVARAFDVAKDFVVAEESIKNLEASFTALTGSAERGYDMLAGVFRIVNATGAQFDNAASAVQRLTIGLNELGATNAQIEQIATNFIMLGRVGGSSMEDINGALLQFTQGLASGRLQGDELRSIFERLPQVIQLIAKEMEISTGEVRKMGAEGKITADIMANALLGATDQIKADFETLPETVEMVANRIEARWKITQNIISQSVGFGEGFKGFYEGLEDLLAFIDRFAIAYRNVIDELVIYILSRFEEVIRIFNAAGADKILEDIAAIQKELDAYNKEMAKASDLVNELEKGQGELRTELITVTETLSEYDKALIKYGETVLKVTASDLEFIDKVELLEEMFKNGEISLRKYNEELRKLSATTKDAFGERQALDDYKQAVEELNILLAKGLITFSEYMEASTRAFEKFSKTTEKELSEFEKNLQRVAVDGFGDLIDVILDADKSFSEFASNFLKQIAKMIIQQQLLNAVKGTKIGDFFGFAKGGAFASPTGLPQGVYNEPTFFPMPNSRGFHAFAQGGTFGAGVLGEAGAEAIVPLKRGLGGDLGVEASPVNIVVNNTISDTVDVYAESTNKQDGSRQIEILVERKVKDSMSNGSLDRIMSTNYGIKRRAM